MACSQHTIPLAAPATAAPSWAPQLLSEALTQAAMYAQMSEKTLRPMPAEFYESLANDVLSACGWLLARIDGADTEALADAITDWQASRGRF